MTDHERIWLEPHDGSDPDIGRVWCQHPAPGMGDDRTWTEYVRADLAAAREAAAREAGMREAAGIAEAYPASAHGNMAGNPEEAARDAANEIAAAILAAIEKEPTT